MWLQLNCIFILCKCKPIIQPPTSLLNPSTIYYSALNGLILQKIQTIDLRNKFEYQFNFTSGLS